MSGGRALTCTLRHSGQVRSTHGGWLATPSRLHAIDDPAGPSLCRASKSWSHWWEHVTQ
ncbi:hypothetical protein [Actinomadura rubteroloni]|uniref:hypothetical protein n=1 Tax=Actinomadura rubteroloni TaxID=1926885 RepID=UPI00143E0455|nr:hypothetical protein [Actinomadura rubteroloni]